MLRSQNTLPKVPGPLFVHHICFEIEVRIILKNTFLILFLDCSLDSYSVGSRNSVNFKQKRSFKINMWASLSKTHKYQVLVIREYLHPECHSYASNKSLQFFFFIIKEQAEKIPSKLLTMKSWSHAAHHWLLNYKGNNASYYASDKLFIIPQIECAHQGTCCNFLDQWVASRNQQAFCPSPYRQSCLINLQQRPVGMQWVRRKRFFFFFLQMSDCSVLEWQNSPLNKSVCQI